MRWNLKKYEVGTRKVERKFAFFPTRLDYPEHETVWLMWYTRELEYVRRDYYRTPYLWKLVKTYA